MWQECRRAVVGVVVDSLVTRCQQGSSILRRRLRSFDRRLSGRRNRGAGVLGLGVGQAGAARQTIDACGDCRAAPQRWSASTTRCWRERRCSRSEPCWPSRRVPPPLTPPPSSTTRSAPGEHGDRQRQALQSGFSIGREPPSSRETSTVHRCDLGGQTVRPRSARAQAQCEVTATGKCGHYNRRRQPRQQRSATTATGNCDRRDRERRIFDCRQQLLSGQQVIHGRLSVAPAIAACSVRARCSHRQHSQLASPALAAPRPRRRSGPFHLGVVEQGRSVVASPAVI